MRNPFTNLLADRAAVVLDGGLATELERRGADLCDPLWSAKLLLENLALIRQVHCDYLEAGADVITSASYQASFEGFARRGLGPDQAADLMRLSVRLAQEARSEYLARRGTKQVPLVAASVGCFGATLHDGSEYRGDYGLTVEQLREWHRPRLEVLARAGADLLACETIPCQAEAEALVQLVAQYPEMPAWLSFSCTDERHVCHGETLAECVAVADGVENIVAVGVNCTRPNLVESLLQSIAGKSAKLLLAYPNSGERLDAGTGCWRAGAGHLDWSELTRRWLNAGARLLGGCCRTTPQTIRTISETIHSMRR